VLVLPFTDGGRITNVATQSICPTVPCYAYASFTATVPLTIRVNHTRAVLKRPIKLRFTVTVDIDGAVSPVPNATIWIGTGRRLTTNSAGRATATIAFSETGRRCITGTANEYLTTTTIDVTAAPPNASNTPR
jgi:hypothetical protein